MPLVVVFWAALLTVVGTHAVAERMRVRLRLWWHRRLTRRHGEMLKRALADGGRR